jgi:hypothetical protein
MSFFPANSNMQVFLLVSHVETELLCCVLEGEEEEKVGIEDHHTMP